MKAYLSIFMGLVLFSGAAVRAEEAIGQRSADDTVRVRDSVVHAFLPYFPGYPKRYLAFAQMLKRRTGAQFLELSFLTRGQPDFQHSQCGPNFEFVILRSGQYITGQCEVPPNTPVADQYCRFYGGDHRLLPAAASAVFYLP